MFISEIAPGLAFEGALRGGGRPLLDTLNASTVEISDLDRDSLHILPLSILPIETPGLNRARLIKNIHLESMVEMFEDEGTGSGQVAVGALSEEFGWRENPPHPDLFLMKKLAALPTYDVYSLRISLRENGIKVNDYSALRLSKTKVEELSTYMTAFTHPLLSELFAGEAGRIRSFSDILAIFRDPDVARVRARLFAMAKALEIQPEKIPQYLEQIGDTFLSISYFRQCTDGVSPVVDGFHESVEEIQGNYQLKSNRDLMKTCDVLRHTVTEVQAVIRRKFDAFDQVTKDMWRNPTSSQFNQIRHTTQDCHAVMGQSLCGLSVKMDAWQKRFPNMDTGGPMKRAEFIMQGMKQGLDKLRGQKGKSRDVYQVW